ncbi:glycosyltransferase [Microbacterium sp. NPDC089695]|uniref:glycosyltransferase n=1 Tax=Microbacterium sp. NPDC089695 TaxID=3364198 RepID=UPI00381AB2C8
MNPRLFLAQKVLLWATYAVCWPFRGIGRRISWIVGVQEVASMLEQIGAAIPGSLTVVTEKHPFYDISADIVISRPGARFARLRRWFLAPMVLGWALPRARGVVYVGHEGFLQHTVDERDWELAFIRARRRHPVIIFTGSDIRSPALLTELAAETGFENIGSILHASGAPYDTEHYEQVRRRRAAVADRRASAIFTARVDQLSYMTSATHAFPYLYPDERFVDDTTKFDDLSRIIVIHAPSRPVIKGTAAVRAAIEQVQARHPELEYRELTGADNTEVLAALRGAHIALNQFHSYIPGVFGIEAMAAQCVMVCSADPEVETELTDASDAWVVARADDLAESLERLLSAPQDLAAQARRGRDWALEHASASGTGERLRRVLDDLSAG